MRCCELAGRAHPEQPSRTIADYFVEEQALLMPVTAIFDGYVEHTTCLVDLFSPY